MVICMERGADLHMAQLMPPPLTISCSSKIQTGFFLSSTEARDSETILLCRSVNKAKPPNVLSCKVSCVRTEIFVGSMLEVQYVTW